MLRYANFEDLNTLFSIENEVFTKFDSPLSLANFKYHIKKKQIILIEENKEVCAYLLFFNYKNTIRLYSLAVSKKHSNKGLATSLLNYSIELAKKSNKNLTLEVRVSNEKAKSIYIKLGFKVIKTLEEYYLDKEDAFKMILKA
ncbi:GNAT family N-acetyltransferase [Arcobacter porcinus]|uniref:Ribosomal-protein-S18-alanine N-acetyltransferase n=1 Tax=Arcobacter porcinus TaxID=1935204 RepID=A0A5C2HGH3_9BACT|nr:N-acetyltransferase [Arcobacter porcinus]OCL88320.1 ribosomal-protein-alanine N-acetyltransferase [Aliarcobacter thereius]OCL81677.1 ribosomal-protein-alanine N-acetyltransferase [Arcobacter porcinus]OCL84530.1 ribosomal-protein-alanine N-acetyltransferase [Arcobacter porcinus]OCL89072.1 ribosomal-protein-alanine N-acetyltransferase [Arcobacter porcinus]QEP39900.1 ribosomal-protein-S18-alanine N-acetyltransferase [Arcobacter porcinus]